MPREYRSTYWYHSGSNWYYRYDHTGNRVTAQLSKKEYKRRNKIIKGIKIAAKRRTGKAFDERAFEDKPKKGTLEIRDEDGDVVLRQDVDEDNYYKIMKENFNRYYDLVIAGDLTYTVR